MACSTSSLYTGEEEVLWDGIKLEAGDAATDLEQKQLYTNYGYNERGLLSSLQHNLESYTYEFDIKGNITKITAGNGTMAEYSYDSLNQLKSESITENGITRTISYAYDSHGNMTSRVEGNTETVYTYDLDRLVQIEEKVDEVTVSTQVISYDGAGNLLNDGENSYTWEMGRQLKGITGTDLTTSYKYNENGLRTEKTVNGMTYEYTLLGSSVTREIIRDAAGEIVWTIHYSYAGDSTPVSMNVNGTEYYYLKNAQGDITHIVDGEGNEVASYEYDAWGNHLSITGGEIAELNPYRYRGYRYDSETGLYYIQSRYYNPEWGRFINVDALVSTGQGILGNNMYIYCLNNPVNMSDSGGFLPKWLSRGLTVVSGFTQVVAGAALGATVGWTGIGAVFAGALVVNGSASIVAGVTDTENSLRTVSRGIGRAVGGETGEKIGATVYDIADTAAIAYSIFGGSATVLSKTANSLGKTSSVQKTFTLFEKPSIFFNEYSVDIGLTVTKFVSLPKPWFRTVNGIGAGVDMILSFKRILTEEK